MLAGMGEAGNQAEKGRGGGAGGDGPWKGFPCRGAGLCRGRVLGDVAAPQQPSAAPTTPAAAGGDASAAAPPPHIAAPPPELLWRMPARPCARNEHPV